jgi:putative nucleotidyltransferase with HDIG domain
VKTLSRSGPKATSIKKLFDVARRLTSAHDLDELLGEIGRVAESLTGAAASSILLLDEDERNLYFKTASGEKGRQIRKVLVPVGMGIAGWVARKKKSLIVNDVSKDARFLRAPDQETGYVTQRLLAAPLVAGNRLVGVLEALNKKAGPFTDEDRELLQDLANFAAVAVLNAQLVERQRNFFDGALTVLTRAVEAHHPAYAGHPARVAETAELLARKLGMKGMELDDLRRGALLHDIGMLAMDHSELARKATLPAGEKSVERLHTVLGYELLKDIRLLKTILPLVRHHHEFWDGTGQPDQLAGNAIPLGARILCLVEQLEEIGFSGLKEPELSQLQVQAAKNGSGSRFDPRVVAAYLSLSK